MSYWSGNRMSPGLWAGTLAGCGRLHALTVRRCASQLPPANVLDPSGIERFQLMTVSRHKNHASTREANKATHTSPLAIRPLTTNHQPLTTDH
jgi:hypothetical protein